MPLTLYASFADPVNAEIAAAALLEIGVSEDDLTVVANRHYHWSVVSSRDGTRFAGRLGGETRGSSADHSQPAMTETVQTPHIEFARPATLCVPGVGNVLGSGLLSQDIAMRMAVSGADKDRRGVSTYLADEGIPLPTAEKLSDIVLSGGAILAVTLPSNNVDGPTGQALVELHGGANTTCYWPHQCADVSNR